MYLTNCIQKIAQSIKLDWPGDGSLTLKAGSEIWYPNGISSDNTKLWSSVTVPNDIAFTYGSVFDELWAVASIDGTKWYGTPSEDVKSIVCSDTEPASFSGRQLWYDTANNKIFTRAPGGTEWVQVTFPFALLDVYEAEKFNIKQVFNGFGFIGNIAFVLPGVTALFADGRNDDETPKNKELTTTTPYIHPVTWSCDRGQAMMLHAKDTGIELRSAGLIFKRFQQVEPPAVEDYIFWYNPQSNRTYFTEDVSEDPTWHPYYMVPVGTIWNSGLNTNLTSFNFFDANFPTDFWNTKHMVDASMPSRKYVNLTLGASGAEYVAFADGYVHIDKGASAAGQYLYIWLPDSSIGVGGTYGGFTSGGNNSQELVCPVKAGERFQINYNAGGNTGRFIFCYAEGDH